MTIFGVRIDEVRKEADFERIGHVIETFENPEDINDDPQTAPSKRLLNYIAGYDKVVYGACLTKEIGLPALRKKCPRFNHWITRLEELTPTPTQQTYP